MCGIVYAKRKDMGAVAKKLLKQYDNQKSRGSQGFGYVVIPKVGEKVRVERAEGEQEIRRKLLSETADEILFHHRYPTSTKNVVEATHPIYVNNPELDFNYYVVHNGVLRNEDELRIRHELLGYEYSTRLITYEGMKSPVSGKVYRNKEVETFNDSESLAIELARFFEQKSDKIDAKGTIAFIAVIMDKDDNYVQMIYGRNDGNPLCESQNENYFYIKSVGGDNIDTNTLYYVENGEFLGYTEGINVGEYNVYKVPVATTKSYGYDLRRDEDIVDETYYSRGDLTNGDEASVVPKLLREKNNAELDFAIANEHDIDNAIYMEDILERYGEVVEQEGQWSAQLEYSENALEYAIGEGDKADMSVHQSNIYEAEVNLDLCNDMMVDIESEYHRQFGEGRDLQDVYSDYVDKKRDILSIEF